MIGHLVIAILLLPFIACPIGVYFLTSNIIIPISAYLPPVIWLLVSRLWKWCRRINGNRFSTADRVQENEIPVLQQGKEQT